jgi:hypothetical protein
MTFYYTTGQQLQEILRMGMIPSKGIAEEKPSVWFSNNPEWEPAANILISDGRGTLVRASKAVTYEIGGRYCNKLWIENFS